jgi:hypothetical protein
MPTLASSTSEVAMSVLPFALRRCTVAVVGAATSFAAAAAALHAHAAEPDPSVMQVQRELDRVWKLGGGRPGNSIATCCRMPAAVA